ncbi:hypothetical protein ACXU4B_15375 [Dyella soli]|uniref:Uncharacterized protein n=1 Tax=Dyella soli TaxID=522319 RepID=A0A4R0YS44_9GAMM|nr:hypothetical protein [Dyella soli]TCI08974.1 hypothetical protein EZM97_22300 [Dyella soli]
MSRITAALWLCLVCSVGLAEPASTPTVTFSAYGAVHVGMSRHELESALGTALKSIDPDTDSEGCRYVAPSHGHDGISFMLINGHLARIDVQSDQVMTLTGAHIGATQQEVLDRYPGRVEISPHAYTEPDGTYLTIYSPDKRHGIRFETYHGRATTFYAGTADAIQYIEGCL